MEEADRLIFQNLYSLGWEIEENDNPCRFKDVETSSIIKGLLLCLRTIVQETSLPSTLPCNMAHRFKVAGEIAKEIKDLGFSGDIGYHSILYPNEVDLRRFFMFLIEKLPKYSQDTVEEPLGTRDIIEQKARDILKESFLKPYTSFCNASIQKSKNDNSGQNIMALSNQLGYYRYDRNLHSQKSSGGNLNEDGRERKDFKAERIMKSSRESSVSQDSIEIQPFLEDALKSGGILQFIKKHKQGVSKKDECDKLLGMIDQVKIDEKARSNNDDVNLKAISDDHSTMLSEMENEISSLTSDLQPMIARIEEKERSISEIEENILVKSHEIEEEERNLSNIGRASSLLMDATDNIAKLEVNLDNLQSKEEKVHQQWIEYKEPLLEEISELSSKIKGKNQLKQSLKNEIFSLKEELQFLVSDAKVKEALAIQLGEQVSRSPNGVNRSVYTKRILDISSKVRKLKEEINKILSDTRLLHKEINSLAGKLSRTFAVVEDSSFKVASSNEQARQVYRCCLTIHEGCQRMCQVVRDTGQAKREKADLMRRVESAKAKNVEENLKVLQEDFDKIKAENSLLKQQLLSHRTGDS